MESKSTAGPVSGVLLLIVGLLAGFIGGYAIARQGAPATPVTSNTLNPAANCQHALDPADRPVLTGIICPSPECTDPLLDCHCDIAHQIKDRAKELLAQGKSHEEVRREIKLQYDL